MKKFRFTWITFSLAIAVCFISCAGEADKSSSPTLVPDTTATASTPVNDPAPASTISTSQQHMIITRHKVGNFAKWLSSYEAHDSLRRANGLHNYVIGRSVADSSIVLVALKADDIEKAKAFGKSADLKQAMQKAGVTGTPKIMFQTTFWQDTAEIASQLRSMLTFSVKDRDAWQKNFDEGKQMRLDNGISTRVLSADADDKNKLSVVTAVLDSAKAAAHWKSDELKKRMKDGGMIGEPERFVFQIVKRY